MDDKQHGRRAAAGAVPDQIRPSRQGRHAAENPDKGRHRAENLADPANTGPIMVPAGKARMVARATAILAAVAATGTAGFAASMPQARTVGPDASDKALQTAQQPVVVPKKRVDQPRVKVKAVPDPKVKPRPRVQAPAPVKVVPVPKVVAPPRIVQPAPVAPAPVPVAPPVRIVPAPAPVVPTLPKPVPKPVPAPVVPPAAPSSKAAGIIAAARAQLGRFQDCTALVTNSLANVGIRFHGWPAGYLGLGRQVTPAEAIPGDLIYYQNGGMGLAHIAVYAGGGQAVHGGWNGNQTVMFSANVGSGPVFIRVY